MHAPGVRGLVVGEHNTDGRERELRDLAELCTDRTIQAPCLYWPAEAWSDKSALMSWFVVNPPEVVDIVSFMTAVQVLPRRPKDMRQAVATTA